MPLEAMSSALFQNRSGMPLLPMLVARKVVVESLSLAGTARFLRVHDHERQAVHKADEVRADGVVRTPQCPGHGHLAHQQEVVAGERLLPVDDPQPFRLLSPVLTVRYRQLGHAGLEDVVHLTDGRDEASSWRGCASADSIAMAIRLWGSVGFSLYPAQPEACFQDDFCCRSSVRACRLTAIASSEADTVSESSVAKSRESLAVRPWSSSVGPADTAERRGGITITTFSVNRVGSVCGETPCGGGFGFP